MTDRQRKFADAYVVSGNATQAYLEAYPHVKNENVARAAGARMLANVSVKSYIEQRVDEISSQKTAEAKEVMEYLTSVLRGESEASIVVVEGRGDGLSEAKIIRKPPDVKDRLKAAELLGKRYGMFTNNINIGGVVPVVISGGDVLED